MSILQNICNDMGIPIKRLTEEVEGILSNGEKIIAGGNAYAINIPKEGKPDYMIFIDDEVDKWEKRLIVAHELAHIIFGHISGSTVKHEVQEEEARIFAGVLIALMLFKEYDRTI